MALSFINNLVSKAQTSGVSGNCTTPPKNNAQNNSFNKLFSPPQSMTGNLSNIVGRLTQTISTPGSGVGVGNLAQSVIQLKMNEISQVGNLATGALSTVTGGLGGAGSTAGLGNLGNVVTGALSTVTGGLGGAGSTMGLGNLGNVLSNVTGNVQGSTVTAGGPQSGLMGLGNSLSANNTGMLGVGGLVGGAASAVGTAAGGVAQGTHHLAERIIDFSGLGPVFGPLVDDTIIHPLLWDPLSMITGTDVSKHPEGVADVSNPLNVDR